MAREPFPSTEDAFAEVRREEVRRKVILTDDIPVPPPALEGSALVTNKSYSHGQHRSDQRPSKRPWCDHYNRPGHTREKCWEIHGKPANWQPRKKTDGCAYQTQSDHDKCGNSGASIPFSKKLVEQLCRLLNQPSANISQPSGSCSVVQSGKLYSAQKSFIFSKDPWIIDSGAFDHMTGGSNLFSSYVPCSNHTTVKIADGFLTPVARIGNIRLSQNLILKSVFHVPALKCNLIFVSKIRRDNRCVAKLPLLCQF